MNLHNSKRFGLLAVVAWVGFLHQASPHAQTIGNAQSFAIVGGQAVTANGAGSSVNGNVGISPAAATFITGFPAAASVTPPFSNHGHDAFAIAAEASADALYNSAAMAPAGGVAITANLSTGGPSANGHYTPGKYALAVGTAILPTTMTLDGAGTYIFSLNSDLNTSVGSTIILNGVDPCTVWWRVPTAPIINGVNLPGTVVSNAGIVVGTGSIVSGRLLTTANGSVTLNGGNSIGGCSNAPAGPPPTPTATDLFITKTHTGAFVVGQNATYTIATSNLGTVPSSGQITVTDTLPAGLTFVSATGVNSWTCAASGQIVTCTTPASVLQGTFGNNITITVLPTAAAVPTVSNRADVAGGNDSNLANNSTIDVTIVAAAVPALPGLAAVTLAILLSAAGVLAMRRRLSA
jgi:uncharacterized repeat protein (TIGR01451 family)